jgi:hypothetical protein
MSPFSMSELTDRASHALASTLAASTQSTSPYAGQRVEPPDARLVQKIEQLSARVELLEKRLRSLSQCAVQQYWNGRLHLPAGKLSITLGQTSMIMDASRFSIVVNGREILGSAGHAPSAPPPQAPAGASLPGGSANSWQSIAAGNAIENPRQSGPGSLLSGT